MNFKLITDLKPSGDQPKAIEEITNALKNKKRAQTLLGVTGSGKTFTMANVIENLNLPTLVVAHNKTLAAQLYQEFRDFFPENAVSYFVSYYDYYQPEAYIPSSDTYIEKDASINDEIDKLRLASTTNLLTRKDIIVVATVSCIYNLGSAVEHAKFQLQLSIGEVIKRETIVLQLLNLQYENSNSDLKRGSFRIRGDLLQIWPAYEDYALNIDTLSDQINDIYWIDPISGGKDSFKNQHYQKTNNSKRFTIYPAKQYIIDPISQKKSLKKIEEDTHKRVKILESENKLIEAHRLKQKVSYDLDMIREFGYCNGIENYSIYFDGRKKGQPPFTLLDYFHENNNSNFLTFVDESHITLPQIRGMHRGDESRKKTLVEYGFRLPSALDNRPLRFDEFIERVPQVIAVSATPNTYEISLSSGKVVEQIIRPTGLVDPNIELKPTKNQIEDLVIEIIIRKSIGQRVLVTTLTKKMAEALCDYLNDEEKINYLFSQYQSQKSNIPQQSSNRLKDDILPISEMQIGKIEDSYYSHLKYLRNDLNEIDKNKYPKVAYLHSDIETLERSDILNDLRTGQYDVVVGINLLREGLDLPEVSLVAILDADKEGFLRSTTSLTQTMGRAARHTNGLAILYADKLTKSMQEAISETLRRRKIQIGYNIKNNILPQGIVKPIRDRMIVKKEDNNHNNIKAENLRNNPTTTIQLSKNEYLDLANINPDAMTPQDKNILEKKLKRQMQIASNNLDFELAALIRDSIKLLQN